MPYPRFLAFVWLAAMANPLSAQQGTVIVENSTSKEVKRTAHRMRIPVERLKSVRTILLRQQSGQEAPGQAQEVMTSSADELESFLVSEYARDNFEAAKRHLQSLDEGLKLKTLIRMIPAVAGQ